MSNPIPWIEERLLLPCYMDYSIHLTLALMVRYAGKGETRLPHRLLQKEPGSPFLHRLFS